MSDTVLYLILLFFLLIFSAFFSGTETAVMSINRYRLRHKAQKGDKTSQKILDMIKNPEKFLALVLIGNNLVNIAASSIATILSIKYFGDYAIAVATFGLTFIVLIFCEITPKTIAALKPELIANKSSVVISFLMKQIISRYKFSHDHMSAVNFCYEYHNKNYYFYFRY